MMNSDQIRMLKDTLVNCSDKRALEFYLIGMMSCQVYSLEGTCFSDCCHAWNSPLASKWKAYLPNETYSNLPPAFFDFVAKLVSDSDGVDFFNSVCPWILSGRDVKDVFSELGLSEGCSKRTLIYGLLKIYGIVRLRHELFYADDIWCGWLDSYRSGSSEEFGQVLESAFDELDWSTQYYKLIDFRERLCHWWFLIEGVPFCPSPVKVSKRIADMLPRLAGTHTEERILELFSIAKDAASFEERIDDTYSYFRKVFSRSNEGALEVEDGPGIRYFSDNEAFERALKKWKNIDTVDFLRSVYFSGETETIEQENCLCHSVLLEMVSDGRRRALVYNANPDFIFRCCSGESASQFCFLFSNRILAELYKQRFSDGCFTYLDDAWELCEVEIDNNKWGRETHFKYSLLSDKFEHALLFYREGNAEKLIRLLNRMKEWLKENGSMAVVLPQSLVNAPPYDLRRILFDSFSCLYISVFPNKKTVQSLRKNMLVRLRISDTRKEDVLLLRAAIYSSETLGNVICRDPWAVKIPINELRDGVRTILELREKYVNRTPKGKRRYSRKCHISKEIVVDYSWSNGRGRFAYYAYRIENDEYKFESKWRGERLTEHKTFSAKSIAEAERIIYCYAFETSLQSVIQKEITKVFRNRPMSLKTFWFIVQNELEKSSIYHGETARILFKSEALSNLMSDESTTLELYMAIMEQDFAEESQSKRVELWRQLNCILSYAEKKPQFFKNPIRSYVQFLVSKDKGYIQIRKSLAKRSYEIEEEKVIVNHLREHCAEEPRMLGAAISFYSGMNDREICALSWGDYQHIVGTDFYQFWVTKILEGTEPKMMDPDNPYAFRRVPVVSDLRELLDECMTQAMEAFTALQKEGRLEDVRFADLPILAQGKDIMRYIDPKHLASARRELDKLIGIEEIIGTAAGKETDFNDYKDNRFRSNFRYRASQSCVMTKAEINYILGLKRPTTFSDHYCDYTNDFVQLTLCRKLERWTHLHRQKIIQVTEAEEISSKQKRFRFTGGTRPRQYMEFDMDIQSLKESLSEERLLKMNMSCSGGADVQLRRVGVKEK